jgi:hypothetical protein
MASRISIDSSDLSCESLAGHIQTIRSDISRARSENSWIEKFFQENSPNVLESVEKVMQQTSLLKSTLMSRSEIMNSTMSHHSMSHMSKASFSSRTISVRSSFVQSLYSWGYELSPTKGKIQMYKKIGLCEKLTTEFHKKIENLENKNSKLMKNWTCQMQMLDQTSQDMQTAEEQFEKNVVISGFDQKLKKISSEKFTKFFESLLKSWSILVDSLRLKIHTMHTKISEEKGILLRRMEMKGILRHADFEQALVEKSVGSKTLKMKEAKFLELKKVAWDHANVLSGRVEKLKEAEDQQKQLTKQIADSQSKCHELDNRCKKSIQEIKDLQEKITTLQEKKATRHVPSVSDYFEKVNVLENLQKSLKRAQIENRTLERRKLNLKKSKN